MTEGSVGAWVSACAVRNAWTPTMAWTCATVGWPEMVGAGVGAALAEPDGAGLGGVDGVALGAVVGAFCCAAPCLGARAASPFADGPALAPVDGLALDALGAGAGFAEPLAAGAGEPFGRSCPVFSTARNSSFAG